MAVCKKLRSRREFGSIRQAGEPVPLSLRKLSVHATHQLHCFRPNHQPRDDAEQNPAQHSLGCLRDQAGSCFRRSPLHSYRMRPRKAFKKHPYKPPTSCGRISPFARACGGCEVCTLAGMRKYSAHSMMRKVVALVPVSPGLSVVIPKIAKPVSITSPSPSVLRSHTTRPVLCTASNRRSSALICQLTSPTRNQQAPLPHQLVRTFHQTASNAAKAAKPVIKPNIEDSVDLLIHDPSTGTRVDRALDSLVSRTYADKPVPNGVRIIQNLAHYLWPKDQPALRRRVVASMVCLVGAKFVSIQVPFYFKTVIDTLTAASTVANPSVAAVASLPALAVLAFGMARIAGTGLSQLQIALFSRVSQHAIRKISLRVFEHVHSLDLAYHLSRQTGAVSRTMERGTRGINFSLSALLFNVFPTALEISLVTGILVYQFGPVYGVVTLATVAAYSVFTVVVSAKRVEIRRNMNKLENEASAKAVDSLINFETVKYFANEELEAKRYDKSLGGYEEAS
eukprot:1510062-Rhodomonas_salina.3